MATRIWLFPCLAALMLAAAFWTPIAPGCAPAPPSGKEVVNADQTVIILWDAATKIEHMIRKASFKSTADDFGFLVPTPSQPELEESGNDAFPYLFKVTEPERTQVPRPSGMECGCSKKSEKKSEATRDAVKILLEKEVAGFKAAILETKSASALIDWLKENGYAYSPQIEAWAKPYVEAGWKITALKVAKDQDGKDKKSVAAAALRITFQTDRPLFPYREPDSQSPAEALGARQRLLRIYLLADARYQGELTKEVAWTGRAAWADKLTAEQRSKILQLLKLPENTGPGEWWLTEFEDNWPYRAAPADLYFARDTNQSTLHRDPIIQCVSSFLASRAVALPALAAVVILPPLLRRLASWRPRTQTRLTFLGGTRALFPRPWKDRWRSLACGSSRSCRTCRS